MNQLHELKTIGATLLIGLGYLYYYETTIYTSMCTTSRRLVALLVHYEYSSRSASLV